MPLNPIDLQVLIPRAAEASRIQHVRDVVPQNDQQTLAGQEKTRHDNLPKQVQKSEHAVKSAIEEEKEKKKKQKKSSSDHNNQDMPEDLSDEKTDKGDPNLGHLVDFSI